MTWGVSVMREYRVRWRSTYKAKKAWICTLHSRCILRFNISQTRVKYCRRRLHCRWEWGGSGHCHRWGCWEDEVEEVVVVAIIVIAGGGTVVVGAGGGRRCRCWAWWIPGAGIDVVDIDGAVSKGHISDAIELHGGYSSTQLLVHRGMFLVSIGSIWGFAAGRTDEIPYSNHNNSDYIIQYFPIW